MTVSRNAETDMQHRQIQVSIDGERIANLLFGQSVTRAIAPGEHRLDFDNTWRRQSFRIRIEPGEHLRYRAVNVRGKTAWFLGAIFGSATQDLLVEREP